jgi:hypothetical protein
MCSQKRTQLIDTVIVTIILPILLQFEIFSRHPINCETVHC